MRASSDWCSLRSAVGRRALNCARKSSVRLASSSQAALFASNSLRSVSGDRSRPLRLMEPGVGNRPMGVVWASTSLSMRFVIHSSTRMFSPNPGFQSFVSHASGTSSVRAVGRGRQSTKHGACHCGDRGYWARFSPCLDSARRGTGSNTTFCRAYGQRSTEGRTSARTPRAATTHTASDTRQRTAYRVSLNGPHADPNPTQIGLRALPPRDIVNHG